MMKRRTFLQRVGSILAILGTTETGLFSLGSRYYSALAQASPRKLALLIGINQYLKHPALNGCLTDVELQRELLVHRFGFLPSDILSLTNEQATRDVIEKAFFDHLGNQVKPGDVVFFHFSGYGSRVKSANALICADSNYLLEETLLFMLRSLSTENIIAILDTSYSFPAILQPSGMVVRARQMPDDASITAAELDLQKQLQSKIAVTPQSFVITATSKSNQLARELQFSGFNTGLFTYALTQYLWEMPTTTVQVMTQVGIAMQQLGGNQKPTLLNSPKNRQNATFDDYLHFNNIVSAQGAVTSVEDDGKTVQLWLGGIAPQILEYYSANSQFTLLPTPERHMLQRGEPPQRSGSSQLPTPLNLIVRSRTGLTAKAIVSNTDTNINLQGQLVREVVRMLPRNIHLNIALDKSLERIERVDATSGFANLTRISSVASEQPADYVFGKLSEAKPKDKDLSASTLLPSTSRYGLFTLSGELIPNTAGEAGEAVKLAVQRLVVKLKTLLAAKLWRVTDNSSSSRLGVNVTLEVINGSNQQVVMQRETANEITKKSSTPAIPVGSRMQIRVENKCSCALYLILVGLDSSKNAFALYSWQKATDTSTAPTQPTLQNIVIEPNSSIVLPQSAPGFEWILQGLNDLYETQLIFSTAPFTQTLAALSATKLTQAEQPRIMPLLNPCEVTQAILQDLHNTSLNASVERKESDTYIWDTNNWASLSFVFQVV